MGSAWPRPRHAAAERAGQRPTVHQPGAAGADQNVKRQPTSIPDESSGSLDRSARSVVLDMVEVHRHPKSEQHCRGLVQVSRASAATPTVSDETEEITHAAHGETQPAAKIVLL